MKNIFSYFSVLCFYNYKINQIPFPKQVTLAGAAETPARFEATWTLHGHGNGAASLNGLTRVPELHFHT